MKAIRIFAALLAVALMSTGCAARNAVRAPSSVAPARPSEVVVPAPTPVPSSIPSSVPSSEPDLRPEPEHEPDRATETDNHAASRVVPTMSADFSQIGALEGEKKGWGPGGPVDNENRPNGATHYQQIYGKYDAYFIAPATNKIYLTFDEGYENGYTAPILDTLKEKNVKAVFFVTLPYAKSEPELIKRMIDEGHTIGNHSSKHLSFPEMPIEEAAADIKQLHDYMKANYGYEMWLFRPPMGEFSEQTLALVHSMGYKTVFWSFAYRDWLVDDQPLTLEALGNITAKCHPGAIYLLHAVSQTNAEILGDAIDQIQDKGFVFASWDIY